MTQVWQRSSDGYQRAGFRVSPISDAGRVRWRLDTRTNFQDGSSIWVTASYHRRLRAAQLEAASIEREQLRRRRITWRLALGTLLLLVSVSAMAFSVNLWAFLGSSAVFGLAIRFWFEAVAIRVKADTLVHSWPHLERGALRVMDSMQAHRAPVERALVSPIGALPPDAYGDADGDGDEKASHLYASPMHVC
jgi:hypothetical protein